MRDEVATWSTGIAHRLLEILYLLNGAFVIVLVMLHGYTSEELLLSGTLIQAESLQGPN